MWLIAGTACGCCWRALEVSSLLPFPCCARYYVEDHGNQLVRTFTGNLTKMLSAAGTGFRGGSGGGATAHGSVPARRDGKALTDGGGVGGSMREPGLSGTGVLPSGLDWTANRLMQTFSGPVRQRFRGKGWGPGSERTSSDGTAEEAGPVSAGIGASRLGTGGTTARQTSKRDHASVQPAVERIDEGEPAEETRD